ncbi:site-specific integrase [Mesorhizobium sp. M3A.F.Ca.ET.080.04.2.1]|uniref:site-specific integrase n=1 Tax=Mesorhizobium sp. M3A.F.Ca.ET.080.04.2.1 TaxID=2493676 RepID=UPI000F7627F3|nr:site-specific integrase [Mesorhizobium sp. M3A.F.Ca.ET.080.04.2.1]AZO11223.1 site-specific integrase [Mesorhizobium sp. M3A.F.Ca.ET.080.04.2.1]RWF24876.1 MAG: site-specific integrase [Mesorhizobium sp.]
MSKTLREAPLTTPNARKGLAEGVHWRGVSAEVHLGYRKGKRAGRWLVRWRLPDGRYKQDGLGAADDGIAADGVETLNFEQAKSKAARHVEQERQKQQDAGKAPIPTVREVVEAYAAGRKARAMKQAGARPEDAKGRLGQHVLSHSIAAKRLDVLTDEDLADWREGLGAELAIATVRRIVNDFRAALNGLPARTLKRLPATYPMTIRLGLKVGDAEPAAARDGAALPDADIRRIIEAAKVVDEQDGWSGDLFLMVLALAATGARFSQVSRMLVGDVQAAQSRLMVPTSRKGRGQKRATHTATRVGTDVIEALRPIIAGRRPADSLLERWRHRQEKAKPGSKPEWVRDSRGPWKSPTELTRPWAAIVKHSGLPADTVPYALRHSSIVRCLRAALPVRLVAQLHDTSDKMIERHYASAIVNALDDLAAAAVVPLVDRERGKVAKLRG